MSHRLVAAIATLFLCFGSTALAQPSPVDTSSVGTVNSASIAAVNTNVVAPVSTQTVETPFVGRWTVTGALKGDLVVTRKDDELTFSGTVNGIPFRQVEPLEGPRKWKVILGS